MSNGKPFTIMVVIFTRQLGAPNQLRRMCFSAPAADGNGAPQYPDAATVLAHMRAGDRLSLVGRVKDLTRQMEAAFREASIIIIEKPKPYASWPAFTALRFGPDRTMRAVDWRELGLLSEHPGEAAIQAAFVAYQTWKFLEVFPETDRTANEAASQAFGQRFHIELIGVRSTQEVDHLAYLLALLPPKILASGALKQINLDGEKCGVDRMGSYADKTLTIHNPYYNWDRYLFTQVLLRKLGEVVLATLEPEAKQAILAAFEQEQLSHAAIPDIFTRNFARFAIAGNWTEGPLNLDHPEKIIRFRPR
ncbi:MAG TPA: hypothetical protein VMT55_04025 [Candidatus Sulfotelmatobacter sp.]|nr:hypothetical protein [Candidatus Sulfotelmatobacter sp.]